MKLERPVIEYEINYQPMENLEAFQNLTVRPVIKMLNSELRYYFNSYCKKFFKKGHFTRQEKVDTLFAKQEIKLKFIGLVLGHFKIEEIQYYVDNTKEIDKRISQIIKERLKSI